MKDEHRADYRQLDVALTLTRIRKLQSDRCYRDQHRLFFIEGVRNFVEAVDHKFPIETLLYSEKLLTAPLARKFVRQLKRAGVPFARASPEAFRSISRAEHVSGIAAILHQRIQTLEQIQPDRLICQYNSHDYFRLPTISARRLTSSQFTFCMNASTYFAAAAP